MPQTKLSQALQYARRGWAVFPVHTIDQGRCSCGNPDCSSAGKHPMTPHGFHDATKDEETIRRWWTETPAANVAIRTGAESGVWVLDVDGADGDAALADLERRYGALPATPRAITGRPGRHILFRWPAEGEIACAARLSGLPIDVRGENGYIVAAPSDHVSGRPYRWDVHPDEAPLAPGPDWLLSWIDEGRRSSAVQTADAPTRMVLLADDLHDAPGAEQGERHQELCRLVGSHLARGEDVNDIEPLATAWAARCTPALPEAEARRVVADLAERHAAGPSPAAPAAVPSSADDVAALPLPPERPWPQLRPAALYGLAGEFVRRIEPETEADPAAILVQFLVMFGCAIGRSAHMIVEEDRHFGNLFAVLVGDTSHGRKGTSSGRVKAIFQHAVDGVAIMPPLLGGLSTGEGLIWAVRDEVRKREPRRERGEVVGHDDVVADEGVQDKRLLVEEAEFARTLKVMTRRDNTLSAVLRIAWDCGNLRSVTKTSPATASGAHIALLGHCTSVELRKSLSETESANGFGNRHLWVAVRRSKHLPEGGRPVSLNDLAERLAEAIRFARETQRVVRDAEATALWRREYPRLSSARGGLFGAVTSRAEAQVLRLSLLYALLDRSCQVRVEHLRAALAVWQYCEDSARRIFGESTGDRLADELLEMIRARPGISRTELHRGFNGHLPRETLVAVFRPALQNQIVVEDHVQLIELLGREPLRLRLRSAANAESSW